VRQGADHENEEGESHKEEIRFRHLSKEKKKRQHNLRMGNEDLEQDVGLIPSSA
jgi:hypothetical protein